MTRVEIVAKERQTAADLAGALAEDERLAIVRAGAIVTPFRPHPDAEVVLACNVSLPSIPGMGPKIVRMSDIPARVRRDPSLRAHLPLDVTPAEIAAALIAAQAGLYVLTGVQLPPALTETDIPDEALTARELQVLRYMADGATNKEIAAALGISSNTAKFHVAQVLAKLNASSRAEAVRTGIRRGLVMI